MQTHWRRFRLLLLVVALFVGGMPLLTPPAKAAPASATSLAPIAAPAAERPAWHSLPLTDARSGQTFTLADFAGKSLGRSCRGCCRWCTAA